MEALKGNLRFVKQILLYVLIRTQISRLVIEAVSENIWKFNEFFQ